MFVFDAFRLDPAALHIFRGERRLEASPQVVEVLAYLVTHRGRTVTRQELLDRFWPRAGTGGDAALNTCIRRIRGLLEDDSDTPRYIQTRPRAGYRFIGSLAADAVTAPGRRRRFALAGGALAALALGGAVWAQDIMFPPHHRLAVEPAQGLCEYVLFPQFNAGLRESFLAEISRRAPPRYDVVAAGAEADLRARMSVRQTPQRTVVTVTLVREADGRLLWTGEYVAATDTEDYVPLQRNLADRMARGLEQALERGPRA